MRTAELRVSFLGAAFAAIVLSSHSACRAVAQIGPEQALFYFDGRANGIFLPNQAGMQEWEHGVSRNDQGQLEFTTARQMAALDGDRLAAISEALRKVEALSIGGWFLCRRAGEQVLLGRGDVEIAPLGERMFPPSDRLIKFCLGTDQHGFFMGAINGNGNLPFVHVTVNQVPIQTWQQLVVVTCRRWILSMASGSAWWGILTEGTARSLQRRWSRASRQR
jgi:hypothetical protein